MKNKAAEQEGQGEQEASKLRAPDTSAGQRDSDSEDYQKMWKEQVIQKLKLLSQNEDLGDVLIKAHAVMKHYQQTIAQQEQDLKGWEERAKSDGEVIETLQAQRIEQEQRIAELEKQQSAIFEGNSHWEDLLHMCVSRYNKIQEQEQRIKELTEQLKMK
jgi:hypothetical protein